MFPNAFTWREFLFKFVIVLLLFTDIYENNIPATIKRLMHLLINYLNNRKTEFVSVS